MLNFQVSKYIHAYILYNGLKIKQNDIQGHFYLSKAAINIIKLLKSILALDHCKRQSYINEYSCVNSII